MYPVLSSKFISSFLKSLYLRKILNSNVRSYRKYEMYIIKFSNFCDLREVVNMGLKKKDLPVHL